MSNRADGVPGVPGARAWVSAALLELPGVPEEVGPVRCPTCLERAAVVRHVPQGDGTYGASMDCRSCGDQSDLWMESYLAGLAVGILIEAARRGDPRVASGSTAAR